MTFKDSKDKDVTIDFSKLVAIDAHDFDDATKKPNQSFFDKFNKLSAPAETPAPDAGHASDTSPAAAATNAPSAAPTTVSPETIAVRKKTAEEIDAKLVEMAKDDTITKDELRTFYNLVKKDEMGLDPMHVQACRLFFYKAGMAMLRNGYTVANAEDSRFIIDLISPQNRANPEDNTLKLNFENFKNDGGVFLCLDGTLDTEGKVPDLKQISVYSNNIFGTWIGTLNGVTGEFTPTDGTLKNIASRRQVYISHDKLSRVDSIVSKLHLALSVMPKQDQTVGSTTTPASTATPAPTTADTPQSSDPSVSLAPAQAPESTPHAETPETPEIAFAREIGGIRTAVESMSPDKITSFDYTFGNPPVKKKVQVKYGESLIIIGGRRFTIELPGYTLNSIRKEIVNDPKTKESHVAIRFSVSAEKGKTTVVDKNVDDFMEIISTLLDPSKKDSEGKHSYTFHAPNPLSSNLASVEVGKIRSED